MTGFVVQGHIYVIIGHLLFLNFNARKKERKKAVGLQSVWNMVHAILI